MRGFINSWIIGLMALSLIVLSYALFSVQVDLSGTNTGYVVELMRWAGDFDDASSHAGVCEHDNLGGVTSTDILQISRNGRTASLNYSNQLVTINAKFTKNYPPYVDLSSPGNNDELECDKNNKQYTFSWYYCDPDSDSVNLVLSDENGVVIGSCKDRTHLSINCTDIPEGIHNFTLTAFDGQSTYTTTVKNVTLKCDNCPG